MCLSSTACFAHYAARVNTQRLIVVLRTVCVVCVIGSVNTMAMIQLACLLQTEICAWPNHPLCVCIWGARSSKRESIDKAVPS